MDYSVFNRGLYMPQTDMQNPTRSIVGVMNKDFNFIGMREAFDGIQEYFDEPMRKDSLRNGLIDLKNELNRFFNDSKCTEVIYTDNTDKMFFGMTVMPVVDPKRTYEYIEGEQKIRINEYYLELDSKLFSIGLSSDELIACLLHEVGHIVNDASPVDRLRCNMAKWICNNGTISSTENVNYREILLYGIKDSIRKMDSIFDKKDEEVLADEFVVAYGYGDQLNNALEKITNATGSINKDVCDKFLVMAWTLRLYQDILHRRIPALYQLRKMIDIAPSHYEREELKKLEVRLRRIDDDSVLGNYVQEGAMLQKWKRNGMKQYEQDLYTLTMQAKNVQREDDALILMNKINSHIDVIEDYIETEELNKQDLTRWNNLSMRYHKLRDVLSDKALVKDDYSRIYVSYPPIRDYRSL